MEDNTLTGTLDIGKTGYNALRERKRLEGKTEDDYLDDFESRYPYIKVESYESKDINDLNKLTTQKFNVTIEIDESNDVLRVNPIVYGRTTRNPFKLEERNYAVDYGYPRSHFYALALKIPEGYEIEQLPENKNLRLVNNGGNYMYNIKQDGGTITLGVRFYLLRKIFTSEEYQGLKEFYNQIIKAEEQVINLKKV